MGDSVEELCNPHRSSREESLRAARRNAEDRRSYDIEIFRYLTLQLTAARVDVDIIERTLEILAAVAPPARLHGAIRTVLGHEDAHVRSKAAVTIGRCVADLPLLQRLLTDSDPRVRANTLEALWQMKGSEVESIFMRALGDLHHRAVANAAYGLYLIDDQKHRDKVSALIEHRSAGFRAAGAWLLGKIGDPKNLPLLKPLLLEKNAEVRSAAFRTLKTLRSLDPAKAEVKSETGSEAAVSDAA